jgi:hypothetical protein
MAEEAHQAIVYLDEEMDSLHWRNLARSDSRRTRLTLEMSIHGGISALFDAPTATAVHEFMIRSKGPETDPMAPMENEEFPRWSADDEEFSEAREVSRREEFQGEETGGSGPEETWEGAPSMSDDSSDDCGDRDIPEVQQPASAGVSEDVPVELEHPERADSPPGDASQDIAHDSWVTFFRCHLRRVALFQGSAP